MKYHFPSSCNPLWWSSLLGVAFGRSSTTVARSFADTIAHGTDKVYEQRKNAKRIHLQTRRRNALPSTILSFQTTPGKEPDPKDILHFKACNSDSVLGSGFKLDSKGRTVRFSRRLARKA
eukprot:scaffold4915_cov229-Chaetoceros_neogracile.AAC.1